jgi:hypothetical protein
MKVFELEEVGAILQRLSESGINANLSWFDLEGFNYILGNGLVGFKKAAKANSDTNWHNVANVVSVMAYETAHLFPDSPFAEWYREITELQDLD